MKCRDCKFEGENYITSLQGQGVYRFSYCGVKVYDLKIVDPDVDRKCGDFREKDGDKSYEP